MLEAPSTSRALPSCQPRDSPDARRTVIADVCSHPAAKIFFALFSAALLICSLPRPDIGWLGWIALVPLILACDGLRPLPAAALGLLTGIVASFGIYGWLFEVPSFDLRHAAILAIYVGAYTSGWCAGTAWLLRRHAPMIVSVPVLWIGMDYLRSHAGFLALPWGTLAQTQHSNLPFLQVASVLGEEGLTFLMALGNAALAAVLLRREQRAAAAAGLLLASAHLWGAAVLYSAPHSNTITVAAIQPNIQIAERQSEEGRTANLARLESLTRRASAAHPALIVWPESAVPGDLHSDPDLLARLQRLTDEIEIPLILGAAQVEKFATGESDVTISRRLFNTAYVLRPGKALAEPYRKRVLVPFAEYLPHADLIPWPEWLAPRVAEMTPGDRAHLFAVSPNLSVGALICWENLFAPLASESVRNGATLLVQLTNDVWFGRSAAPHQHNLMSVLRAVENRVPIVIASNTGPSQIIDGYGRVRAAAPGVFREEIVTSEIPLGGGSTVSAAPEDGLTVGMLLAAAMVLIGRRQPRGGDRRLAHDIGCCATFNGRGKDGCH